MAEPASITPPTDVRRPVSADGWARRQDRKTAHRNSQTLACLTLACLLAAPAFAHDPRPADAEQVKVVSAQKLPNIPGQSLTAVTVDVPPGDVSPPHRHAGFVFVYVLDGTVESQLNAEPAKRFVAGDTWVEPPGTLHARMANPSKTEPARILAVFVAPDGAELTRMQ